METMIPRLAEDHANARLLARGLAKLGAFEVDAEAVQTNILMAWPKNGAATDVVPKMGALGVKANAFEGNRIRFVTHYGIEAGDIEEALGRIGEAVGR